MRFLGRLLCLLMLISIATAVLAQTETLSEAEYWQRLKVTRALLAQSDLSDLRANLQTLWGSVGAVQHSNDLIEIDPGWIIDMVPPSDPLTLQDVAPLQQYIDALLETNERQSALSSPSMETLRDILENTDFQYGEQPRVVPTPRPIPDLPLPDVSAPAVSILQIIFAVVIALVVLGVIIYVFRLLKIQPAVLAPDSTPDDDPRTSLEAQERAQAHEGNLDYRQAVRYRFLALLLLLDERGIIHYDPSLTNREHVRQINQQPHIESLLPTVVNTFDAAWYGFIPLTEADYQRYIEQIEQLQASIGAVSSVAGTASGRGAASAQSKVPA